MTKIGIIGGGNMGTAIINGIRKKYSILVCEKDPKRAADLKKKLKVKVADLEKVVTSSSAIILAHRMNHLDSASSQTAWSI